MPARRSLRAKAAALFTAMTLLPVTAAVVLLIDVNRRPVRTSEEMLQSAVLAEIAGAVTGLVRDVESDAAVAAALFGRAVAGDTREEDAIAQVSALLTTRDLVDAVRLEVPAAKLSTAIRKQGAAAQPPEGTPELRRLADDRGVAFGVTGPDQGIVVASVPARGGPDQPRGYVVAAVPLHLLANDLRDIVERRFPKENVGSLLLTRERAAVASVGAGGVAMGADVSGHPVVAALAPNLVWDRRMGAVGTAEVDGRPVVGAMETLPDLGCAIAIWRPQEVAFAAITRMQRWGLLVAAAAVLLALAAGIAAGRGLTRPILDLVAQARLIGQRRWRDVRLTTSRGDELGELTASLGQMAKDLEEGEAEVARQAKLRGDLSRFMDKAVVEAIVRGEHPLSLGGQRAAVTVLFADVVGFTPLAESREAERIVALLNELFSVLTEIVFRHGGTVDKFIGDCIMAVWGAPVPQEDHAARALSAAEDMMRFLEAANDDWKRRYDVEIRLGIGVSSGEAIVGNIGSDKRMEYTVIGDVVNVGARLEAIAAPNQVLVAEATRALAGDAFPLRYLGEQALTGRQGKTQVYALDPE